MGILSVHLNNTNLNDVTFDEDNPETIIYIRLMAWHNRFIKYKTFKKDLYK